MGNVAKDRDPKRLRQAEADTVDDSIENLDEAPMSPLMVVPRPMAFGAMAVGLFGAAVGAGIGAVLGLAIFGTDRPVGFVTMIVVLAVAGSVAGGVAGGWRGGQGAKARDEQRPSHAGNAPGTQPIRRGAKPDPSEPIGWK